MSSGLSDSDEFMGTFVFHGLVPDRLPVSICVLISHVQPGIGEGRIKEMRLLTIILLVTAFVFIISLLIWTI